MNISIQKSLFLKNHINIIIIEYYTYKYTLQKKVLVRADNLASYDSEAFFVSDKGKD